MGSALWVRVSETHKLYLVASYTSYTIGLGENDIETLKFKIEFGPLGF